MISVYLTVVLLVWASAEVLVQPQTHVTLPGVNVTFTCKGNGKGQLVINGAFDGNLHGLGISYFSTPDPQVDGCDNTNQLTVNINAQISRNNDTRLSCYFGAASPCTMFSHTAKLIIVEDPPGPPGAPTLTVINLTTLTLTWTAPWPHPISDYTVTMLNLTSGQQNQWTTFDEYLVVKRGEEEVEGQCNELIFTVEAETDVGSSGNSPNTSGGFPKELGMFQELALNVNLTFTNIQLKVVNPPSVCSYETITYTYALHTNSCQALFGNWTTSESIFTIELGQDYMRRKMTPYCITVVIENEAGMAITLDSTIPSTIISYMDAATTSKVTKTSNYHQRTAEISATTLLMYTSVLPNSDSATNTIIAVAIGSAGGIGLILCLLAFLCIAVCVYMAVYQHRRKQQVKRFKSTLANSTRMEITMPHSMRDNPLYDTSNNCTIYDLPEIATLQKESDSQQSTPTSSPHDLLLPPKLPPPRNGDAATTCSEAMHVRSAQRSTADSNDKEEYIEMISVMSPPLLLSPRYTEVPTMKSTGFNSLHSGQTPQPAGAI